MTDVLASGPLVLAALILTSGLLVADIVHRERRPGRPVLLRYRVAGGIATAVTFGLIAYRFYFYTR